MEGGWKTPPPQCYNETKKPSAYRVKLPYLPMHETIFCQKTQVLAATSNLLVEQNLMHLGRFLHFS